MRGTGGRRPALRSALEGGGSAVPPPVPRMVGGARQARWRNGGGADAAQEKVEAAAAFGRAHGMAPGRAAVRF